MASVKYSSLVSDVRGRIGSMVYSGWKAGVGYVKNMSTSVNNPNSVSQDLMRSALSRASKYWFDTLTPAQRGAWETYAKTKPGYYAVPAGVKELVGSNGGIMSGFNAFILVAGWLKSIGKGQVADPPLSVTPPNKPLNCAATCTSGTLTVNFDPPGGTLADDVTRVWVADASGVVHKQINAYVVTNLATAAITQIKGAMGVVIPLTQLVGSHFYVQCDTVSATGTKSGGSNTAEVIIA